MDVFFNIAKFNNKSPTDIIKVFLNYKKPHIPPNNQKFDKITINRKLIH